ncbi:MAG: hypothetical protein J6B87_03025 [Clostridia bacterium]|nr:hypothetical protein [Clostridia bacterium]
MLTSEEILKLKEPPSELLELHLYQALEIIRWRYHNNQINKETAFKLKDRAVKKYDAQVKQYEFMTNMFKEHVENIKKTETLKIEFRKNPNLDTAKKLLELYSGEMFI